MTIPNISNVFSLDSHYKEFKSLLELAQHCLDQGQLESAAVYTQVAGSYAWFNHTGLFACPELENILGKLATHLTATDNSSKRTHQTHEVLHVATEVYQTGGPTQAIACWIAQDSSRHHRVCLTRQGYSSIPEKITTRLTAQSDLLLLDNKSGGLLRRAATLREIAQGVDVILLHSHPYDVVPILAFSGVSNYPPVIYVNHADHVFWLGTSVANVVLNMRDSGQALAVDRRGVDPTRSIVMERPLCSIGRSLSREEAKRQLNIRPEQVLVVTTADAPKYRAVTGPSLLDIIVPVFERHDNALLLAAGPAPEDEWAVAEKRTQGRVKALGRLPNVTLLHQAADIYIDSFPFSSLTSLIEAGSNGTPVITYRGHPEECAVLGADTHGVDEYMCRPTSVKELQSELSCMITDTEWRDDLGKKIQQAILKNHQGEVWRTSVSKAYDIAARSDLPITVSVPARKCGPLDVLVNLIMEETGYCKGVTGAMRDNLGLFPAGQRVAEWVKLARNGEPLPLRYLLPEWLLIPLGRCWRMVRRASVSKT
ncbi:MAG: hypothetical protein IPN42_03890 [Methylococcaceae bacterium]|nr:hypothetical protein [Methylococcaceae bacterium]